MELIRPRDFTDPDALYRELVKKIQEHYPGKNMSLLHRAYMTARNAHMDQRRKSGEPYIIHPLCVAIILADLGMDVDTIIAGILHDIVEDTILGKSQLRRIFGDDVAEIVDGVTKLTALDITENKSEEQAENLRKMFMAMTHDIRVIMVKLADRLHNMRTLTYMKPEKQKEKSRETLDIYSPIAQRLGISMLKDEMDDIALRYLEPEDYASLRKKLDEKATNLEGFMERIVDDVRTYMDEAGIRCEVSGRVKHLFSIYKKMVNQNKTLDQIYDVFAVRIIVDTVKDCYAALGIIHEHYKPIPGRFKDYIAMPKANMYQSLHTTLIGPEGQPFEIQIRTLEMHKTAEFGIAAHWRYKEAGSEEAAKGGETDKLNWLHKLMEIQSDNTDNEEFMKLIKSDLNLFSDQVYCFTPKGTVITLPKGSTTIDFAYAIHTAVGNRMVGARVNDQLVPIDYVLQNGDRVDIITSQNSRGPSRDWLGIVKSTGARNKINNWFKNSLKEENIASGREQVEKYCRSHQISFDEINRPEILEKVLSRYSCKDWDSMLATIGHGGLKEGQVINRMVDEYKKILKKEETDEQVLEVLNDAGSSRNSRVRITSSGKGITVQGVHDLAVRFSSCCKPVPGDEIVGYVTRGRGITIHRTDCINVINMSEADRSRLIPAEWNDNAEVTGSRYMTMLSVYARNRLGMIVDVTRTLTEKGIDIVGFDSHTSKDGTATLNISFEISGTGELRSIIERLRQVDGVIDVERTSG